MSIFIYIPDKFKIMMLRRILSRVYNYWLPKERSILSVLENKFSNNNNYYFLEIGANNAESDDPIFDFVTMFNWSGCYLEPQSWVFKNELEPKFAQNSKVTLINAALDYQDGQASLFKLNFGDSSWVSALASFDKVMIEKHINHGWILSKAKEYKIKIPKDKSDWIIEEIVQCISFKSLLAQLPTDKIDLLMIDTEGFDFEVIKMFPFNLRKPSVIIYEHRHLSKKEYRKSIKFLNTRGYRLYREIGNTIAELKNDS